MLTSSLFSQITNSVTLVVRSVLTRTFWLHSYVLSFVTQQKKGTAKSCGAVTECWSARWAELPNVLDLKFIKILSSPLFEGRWAGLLNRFPMRKCAFVGETRERIGMPTKNRFRGLLKAGMPNYQARKRRRADIIDVGRADTYGTPTTATHDHVIQLSLHIFEMNLNCE